VQRLVSLHFLSSLAVLQSRRSSPQGADDKPGAPAEIPPTAMTSQSQSSGQPIPRVAQLNINPHSMTFYEGELLGRYMCGERLSRRETLAALHLWEYNTPNAPHASSIRREIRLLDRLLELEKYPIHKRSPLPMIELLLLRFGRSCALCIQVAVGWAPNAASPQDKYFCKTQSLWGRLATALSLGCSFQANNQAEARLPDSAASATKKANE
jgi:hypothetical protein